MKCLKDATSGRRDLFWLPHMSVRNSSWCGRHRGKQLHGKRRERVAGAPSLLTSQHNGKWRWDRKSHWAANFKAHTTRSTSSTFQSFCTQPLKTGSSMGDQILKPVSPDRYLTCKASWVLTEVSHFILHKPWHWARRCEYLFIVDDRFLESVHSWVFNILVQKREKIFLLHTWQFRACALENRLMKVSAVCPCGGLQRPGHSRKKACGNNLPVNN